ncbi:hypothetical protein V494_01988 [Pseudogymnoascus sp. VKM F-4513 (FW-928)]|nr:hypothetical protein V494_01988 [Pseudogymnoascus sp. VKM F-4513 (FW-928)]
MRTSFTSSYLLPGIVLNPVILLHGFNTYASHYIPSAMSTIASYSRYKWMEDCGPPGNQLPYFYVHTHDSLCWSYTAVIVAVQVLAYIKIVDDRAAQKQIHLQTKAKSDKPQWTLNGADREADTHATKTRHILHENAAVDGK